MGAWLRLAGILALAAGAAGGQDAWEPILDDPDPKLRIRAVRLMAEAVDGFRHLDRLEPLLRDSDEDVRAAAVSTLIRVRTLDAQRLLMQATTDPSPRVQSLAVDGLVDFYVPNYVKTGLLSSLRSFASSLKGRFSKPSPLTVSAYVRVNPETVRTIGAVIRQGRSDYAQANAARAVGILRGRAALDDLLAGIRSRNSTIILECLLAIKKLGESAAGPEIVFLLDDPDRRIREVATQTVGQLRVLEAVPGLVGIVRGADKANVRVQALIALAKIPGNGQRELFLDHLVDKNKGLRAAAAEGLGRIGNPDDARLLDHHFRLDKSGSVRLSLAFAGVLLGNHVRLNDLVAGLDSTVHRLEARPFLVELARDEDVLKRLYVPLSTGSDPQRRHLAYVVSQSGTADSVPHLESLASDGNTNVAAAAIEALRVLRARL